MQVTHSPKPKIFGEGYGKHVAYNYALMKKFFWLGWKMMANMIIPAAFYERAHWEVIDLYHKMSGFRHGTRNDHRCTECGHEKLSSDDKHLRYAELKDIEQDCQRIDEFDMAMDEYIGNEKHRQELEDLITPEIEERIRQIESGEVEGIDWRELEEETSDK